MFWLVAVATELGEQCATTAHPICWNQQKKLLEPAFSLSAMELGEQCATSGIQFAGTSNFFLLELNYLHDLRWRELEPLMLVAGMGHGGEMQSVKRGTARCRLGMLQTTVTRGPPWCKRWRGCFETPEPAATGGRTNSCSSVGDGQPRPTTRAVSCYLRRWWWLGRTVGERRSSQSGGAAVSPPFFCFFPGRRGDACVRWKKGYTHRTAYIL